MAITLAEAKATMVDKVDQAVVDEFRRESFLLDKLTFDDAAAPVTGGSTLTYSYTRLKTPSTASTRTVNTEYTADEAIKEKCSVDLKILGGSFNVDRVIQNTSGQVNEIQFQLKQKIKATKNLFHYLTINGDSAYDSAAFDGLDAILTGASTEYKDAIGLDVSSTELLDANYKRFIDVFNEFLKGFGEKPDAIFGNYKSISRIQSIAYRAGHFSRSEDSFGRPVATYDGIPLVDLGNYFNGTVTAPVVNTYSATVKDEEETGLSDIYVVKFGLDGLHGVSPAGGKILSTYLPDMNAPGAVKTGEVEFVAGLALKNSLMAGVMRGIKIQ